MVGNRSPKASRFSASPVPSRARACQFLSSTWLLDPIHGGGHAEHAHEGARGLLVAGGDGAPLFEPCPETLDPIAVVVDPGWAGDVMGRRRDGQATSASLRLAGVAGRAPRLQMRSREAWLA